MQINAYKARNQHQKRAQEFVPQNIIVNQEPEIVKNELINELYHDNRVDLPESKIVQLNSLEMMLP